MKKTLFSLLTASIMLAFLAYSGNTTYVLASSIPSLPSLPGSTQDLVAEDVVDLDTLNTWLDTRPARTPSDVDIFNFEDNRRDELQHITREWFEDYLPTLMYEYEEFLYNMINNARTNDLVDLLDEYWHHLSFDRITHDLNLTGIASNLETVVTLFSTICEDCGQPKVWDLLNAYGLHATDHIVEVAFFQVGEFGNIVLIRMQDNGWFGVSTYIALTFIENDYDIRVFNLERVDEGYYYIVAVFEELEYLDLGVVEAIEAETTGLTMYELFLEGILEAIGLSNEEAVII